ncbi:hypothetical protein [Arenimonas sp.]|uniref:hypothetical protein n=1 Tax=Arenimonas sp. TaxID=1872635 RepID=UPI0039E4DE93
MSAAPVRLGTTFVCPIPPSKADIAALQLDQLVIVRDFLRKEVRAKQSSLALIERALKRRKKETH